MRWLHKLLTKYLEIPPTFQDEQATLIANWQRKDYPTLSKARRNRLNPRRSISQGAQDTLKTCIKIRLGKHTTPNIPGPAKAWYLKHGQVPKAKAALWFWGE